MPLTSIELDGGYGGFSTDDIFTALPSQCAEERMPVLLFLERPDDESKEHVAAEQALLFNEKLGIASQMFYAFRLDGTTIDDAHPFHDVLNGHSLPRLIVLDTEGQRVGSLEGKQVTAKKIYPLMKKGAATEWALSLDKFVSQFDRLLDDLDKLTEKRADLAEAQAKEKKLTDAKIASYEKREQAVWDAEDKLYEKEDALLKFERKKKKVKTTTR